MRRTWEKAERVIEQIENSDEKAQALRTLAVAYARRDKWEEVERVIEQIENSLQKAQALSALAVAYARRDKWEEAKRTWEKAERVIEQIENRLHKNQTLSMVAAGYAERDKWKEAERVIEQIERSYEKAWALCKLSEAVSKRGNIEIGTRIVQHSWSQAQTRDEAFQLFPLTFPILFFQGEPEISFLEAFKEVDHFLKGK